VAISSWPALLALSTRCCSRAIEPRLSAPAFSRFSARSIRWSILGACLHSAFAPSPVGVAAGAGVVVLSAEAAPVPVASSAAAASPTRRVRRRDTGNGELVSAISGGLG
jgi:hypothetical protein